MIQPVVGSCAPCLRIPVDLSTRPSVLLWRGATNRLLRGRSQPDDTVAKAAHRLGFRRRRCRAELFHSQAEFERHLQIRSSFMTNVESARIQVDVNASKIFVLTVRCEAAGPLDKSTSAIYTST